LQRNQSQASPLGDIIRVAGSLIKEPTSAGQQNLFGIDDAILIPAVVSIISAAIKAQSNGTTTAATENGFKCGEGREQSVEVPSNW